MGMDKEMNCSNTSRESSRAYVRDVWDVRDSPLCAGVCSCMRVPGVCTSHRRAVQTLKTMPALIQSKTINFIMQRYQDDLTSHPAPAVKHHSERMQKKRKEEKNPFCFWIYFWCTSLSCGSISRILSFVFPGSKQRHGSHFLTSDTDIMMIS